MKSILIAGNIGGDESNESRYGQVLARELSASFKIHLAGSFLKAFKLATDVDIVFALSPIGNGYAGYIFARFRKKRFLIMIDDDYAWRTAIESGRTYLLVSDFQKSEKSGRIATLHKRQVRLCAKAELVIVPSQFLADIVTGWGIEKEKIRLIHGAVDFIDSEVIKEEARKKIAIPGNLLISVGPLVPWKGFRMLIKLMPQLLNINQFFRLVIVGEGPEYKILRAMIKNMGLDRKVYLVGKKNKEELACFLTASDIFILNSGHEGFPYQVIEAMATGVPVITTAVGANLELIRQGENGFMVKYNDEFNLVEAVKTIWQTPELRERFIEEGKLTAAQFSTEKMTLETAKIFNT